MVSIWFLVMGTIHLYNISLVMKWDKYNPENAGKWALVYKTIGEDIKFPSGKDVFGATSFQGVFTPTGFHRGSYMLTVDDGDGIDAFPVLRSCSERDAFDKAKDAAKEISDKVEKPSVILMHATPGFEERVLDGINDVFGNKVPVYGGSAGDDDLTGKWEVFYNGQSTNSGFLLVGFTGKTFGYFLSGYLPTNEKGVITKAKGRIVYEIDGRPAAIVYNEWTGGLIERYLDKGGVILADTTLRPVGRVIGRTFGVPKYLLSHPHMVIPESKALTFFTEFKEWDEIVLMRGTKEALLKRAKQVVDMSLKGKDFKGLKGAILIYCAGCVGVVMDGINEAIENFKDGLGRGVPFVGCATFGEQGCFLPERENRHGNLMANTIIFAE